MIVRLASKKPVAAGVNVTEIVQLAPGGSGEAMMQVSVSANGAGIEIDVTTSAAPPVFVKVAISGEEVVPIATAPKLVKLGEIFPNGRPAEPLRAISVEVFGTP